MKPVPGWPETIVRLEDLDGVGLPAPTPLPDALPPVPAFVEALLPDALRGWCCDIAERLQCPPEFAAVGAVVALSGVVGRQIGVRPKARDPWHVVPNTWGGIIGRPGVMKSPALREVCRPLMRLELLARSEFDNAEAAYQVERTVAEARAKETQREITASIKAGNLGAAHDRAYAAAADVPAAPVRRRYLTSDCTVEKLGELLAANPRGIVVFRDELVGWLQSLDREGREGTRAFFLEAWAGDGSFTFDRIGRGTLDIESCCVSVLGGIQPGPLGRYLEGARRGGLDDDGLVQRFQVLVWPDVSGEWRNVDRFPDSAARRTAWETFTRLDQIDARALGAEFDEERPYLRFSGAALELFGEWHEGLERRLRAPDDPDVLVSHLAKYRSLVPSLALIFHLADGGTGAVPEDATLRALGWAEFLEAHARRIYHAATEPGVSAAKAILARLRRGDLQAEFSARELRRRHWSGLADSEAVESGLEVLVEYDWLFRHELPTGGRPTVIYRLNPKARP